MHSSSSPNAPTTTNVRGFEVHDVRRFRSSATASASATTTFHHRSDLNWNEQLQLIADHRESKRVLWHEQQQHTGSNFAAPLMQDPLSQFHSLRILFLSAVLRHEKCGSTALKDRAAQALEKVEHQLQPAQKAILDRKYDQYHQRKRNHQQGTTTQEEEEENQSRIMSRAHVAMMLHDIDSIFSSHGKKTAHAALTMFPLWRNDNN